MAIQEGNIKLLKSEVMDDVPEGGGQATGNEIQDGSSNSIFPDISELDRTYGRVNLRKVYVGVQTPDTDKYFGANVIISDTPDDENVSCTLFTTEDNYDHRTEAASRVEAYLFSGPTWAGYLFENHIAGQRAISILQREGSEVPPIGRTLVLNDGTHEQYVRVTNVSTTVRTFTDNNGADYKRMQVICEISDALRYNFIGSPATPQGPTNPTTVIRDTLVADATQYFGTSKLVLDADTGDRTVKAASIYTQLVPAAQTEVPATDVRTNLDLYAPVLSSTGFLTVSTAAALSPTASIYVGAGIMPGTLTVSGAATLTDSNGELMSGATSVGEVDYQNGVLSINAGGPTYSGSKTIQYKQAASPVVTNESFSFKVTQENRSLSLAMTLNPIPAPATLQIHYMAQGRWYVLREKGGGAIKGDDSAFGAGQLSYTTGGLTVSFGALPDVDSSILLYWGRSSAVASSVDTTETPKAYFLLNVGNKINPGTLTLTWDDGGTKTSSEVNGSLTGAATGQILDYANGVIKFSPNNIPTDGTSVSIAFASGTKVAPANIQNFVSAGASWQAMVGADVVPRTFYAQIYRAVTLPGVWAGTYSTSYELCAIKDNGSGGVLLVQKKADGEEYSTSIGTINYSTGEVLLSKTLTAFYSGYASTQQVMKTDSGAPTQIGGTSGGFIHLSSTDRTETVTTILSSSSSGYTIWSGSVSQPALSGIQYVTAPGGSTTVTASLTDLKLTVKKSTTSSLISSTLRFSLGGVDFADIGGNIVRDFNAATNTGTVVGTMDTITSTATINTWGTITNPTATVKGGTLQHGNALITDTAFRAPVSPIRPGSFSVAATRASDNVTITATADLNGIINTANMIGVVDYETGVARVWFGRKTTSTNETGVDMSDYVTGVTAFYPTPVFAETARFSTVSYTYLPLDAELLGLDPVRLPSDGRVPIFRAGNVAVVHNTTALNPVTVSNGQTVNCGRTRLSRVRVIGHNGSTITSGYTTDLDAGTVTFTNVTGYSQPVTVESRIEDMVMVKEAQINGSLTLLRPLSHDYSANESWVSSALIIGDMRSRIPLFFDQATWTGAWSDTLIGSSATASYNSVLYPPEVTNSGAITERWALIFTNTTTFNVVGEHVGQIMTGTTSADLAPINPATGTPYFTIQSEGWGSGWVAGNVFRLNTVGALAPVWIARTIKQGDSTAANDAFSVLIRGDVDRP